MACQLYLVIECSAGAPERLTAALDAAPIASVLLVPEPGKALLLDPVRVLVERAQSRNVAALLVDDARLARTLRADGVHLSPCLDIEAGFASARDILGGRALIGVSPGQSRHDAMSLAEAGADYIAFEATEPSPPATADDDTDAATIVGQTELISWWAEIFQLPVVAFGATTVAKAAELASAGADFVAVQPPAGITLAEIADMVRAFQATVVAASRDTARN